MASSKSRCPHCVTYTLVESRVARQRVLECRDCKGVWFEDGSLNRAIVHKHDNIERYNHEEFLGDKVGLGDRLCLRCSKFMERFHLLEQYEVEVDCCPTCNGIWLDREEVQGALHSPQMQRALNHLKQSVSWRSWVFQFLTRMPVEYNLKPHITPWMTWSIIALCTILFVVGQFSADLELRLLMTLGFNSETPNGLLQTAQLVTSQFMHGSWLHLIGNMYFLWIVGDNVEDAVGHWRYLALYLVSGVVAALTEWAFFDTGSGPLLLVGASGAIAALFGMYLVWFRYASLTFMVFVFQVKVAPHWYFLIWSGTNILGMWMGDVGVAYWAHLGGFAFGLLVGLLMNRWVRARNPMLDLLNRPEIRLDRFKRFRARLQGEKPAR